MFLHGGRADGLEPPPPLNLPGRRLIPFRRAVVRAAGEHSLALRTAVYRHRGWNGPRADPVHDASRALDELAAELGPVPVVLVGHSMGGRAALRIAGHPQVVGVVGLAPWCPDGEPVDHLAGRDLVLLHGDRDRTTSPRGTRELAARARLAGARACVIEVEGGDHAMLRRAGEWHTATGLLTAGLLGFTPLPTGVGAALRLPGDGIGDAESGVLRLDACW
ncbi:alpha/beta hydrolase [Streptomyces sp. NBC_00237]|uniref:alpha/beta fold hydrolase n=1 Tax=Streptomyces sp. NBC_00237 TaxID=2975687 RepID=UPI00225C17B1|nr:alpha/beta hydrolase [Streptomyces sp. NBC_00237]MCX5207212.1 alpha/beta hydrolase [Streptomyces sp. NBC_00237]